MISITRRTAVVTAGVAASFAVLVLAMVGAWVLISSVGLAPEAGREGESVSTPAVEPSPTTASEATPGEESSRDADQGPLPWRIEHFGSRRVASAWGDCNRWKVAVHCPTRLGQWMNTLYLYGQAIWSRGHTVTMLSAIDETGPPPPVSRSCQGLAPALDLTAPRGAVAPISRC